MGFTECLVNVDVDKDTKGVAFRAVKPMFCRIIKGYIRISKGEKLQRSLLQVSFQNVLNY